MNDNQPIDKEELVSTLYSQKVISIASYMGTPIASGYLIRENFIRLGDKNKGNWALGLSISFTIMLFVSLIYIPENIIDKIPNFLIPAFYTGIIYWLVDKYQGAYMKTYEEAGNKYISNWKAAGIGAIGMLIIATPIAGAIYLENNDPVLLEYNSIMDKFIENEEATFSLYTNLQLNPVNELLDEINNKSIPYWKKNKTLIDSADQIEGITEDLLLRNNKLRAYCDLRIQEFTTFRGAVLVDSQKYYDKIDSIHIEIETLLKEIE